MAVFKTNPKAEEIAESVKTEDKPDEIKAEVVDTLPTDACTSCLGVGIRNLNSHIACQTCQGSGKV